MTFLINVASRVGPWLVTTACAFIAADQMKKRREEALANAALVRALRTRIDELTKQIQELASAADESALVEQLRAEWVRLRAELAVRQAEEFAA